jgi:oligosaccharide 4-alpha-D-glucosyltransferase
MKPISRLALTLFLPLCAFAQLPKDVVSKIDIKPKEIVVYAGENKMIFSAYPSDILQTTIETVSYKGEQISNAVINKGIFCPDVVRNDREALTLRSGKHWVRVDKQTGALQYGQQNGLFGLTSVVSDSAQRKLRFAIQKEEQFFGTGSRSIALNKKGFKVDLNNNPWYGYSTDADNLNFSMPFIQSNKGYAIFFDNPSKGYFDVGKNKEEILEAGFSGGKLQFYTFCGGSPAKLIEKFTSLVGRMPMPARWVLGNFMSRFGYRSQDEVLEIAGKMKAQNFPIDAAIIDLFWFGDGVHGAWNMGDIDWNLKRFPEPVKMIDSLKKMNIKTILITEPFVLSESKNYQYSQSQKLNAVDKKGDTIGIKEFWFGYAGLLDLFKNKSKDWFWNQYDRQIKKGVAGWWGDLGEPEKHPNYLYHNLQDYGHKRLFNADEVHNMYGHLWSEMLYEKYKKYYPNERLFHLNRSGYAGTWRYGSFPWSGDVDRSWKGLKAQLPIMLSMGLSGVPTMHSDAGGFAMGERDPELYRRWLQMAVFSPIFRPHGSVSAPDPNIAQIESEPVFYDEPDKSIIRNFIELRYRLMPYIYNVAYESAKTGAPFVRPLFFNDTSDSNLFKANDQYYFGNALMVAPVLEKGAKTRKLYLPFGQWYDFWNPSAIINGGRWVEVQLTAEQIPVFVKAGTVLPMKPLFKNTNDYPKDEMEWHYYPNEGSHSYALYEDDGQTAQSLINGAYEIIRIHAETRSGKHIIRFSSNGKSYTGKPSTRELRWVLHGVQEPKNIFIDGKSAASSKITDNSREIIIKGWKDQLIEIMAE